MALVFPNPVILMALLQYGLPQFISVSSRAKEVGCMVDEEIRSGKSIECKNQILPVLAFNTEPYYKRAMVILILL